MTAALSNITNHLIVLLDTSSNEKLPFDKLISYIGNILHTPQIVPFNDLCLELISLSKGRQDPYYSIVQQIIKTFESWIDNILLYNEQEDRASTLALALAITEGLFLIKTVNFDDSIDLAVKAAVKFN